MVMHIKLIVVVVVAVLQINALRRKLKKRLFTRKKKLNALKEDKDNAKLLQEVEFCQTQTR